MNNLVVPSEIEGLFLSRFGRNFDLQDPSKMTLINFSKPSV
jgi:hypothetical protein